MVEIDITPRSMQLEENTVRNEFTTHYLEGDDEESVNNEMTVEAFNTYEEIAAADYSFSSKRVREYEPAEDDMVLKLPRVEITKGGQGDSSSNVSRMEESVGVVEVQDSIASVPVIFFSPGNSFMPDDYGSYSYLSSLNPLSLILPRVRIEWVKQPTKLHTLHIKASQEPKPEESNKATSYSDVFYKATIGFKAIDISVDAFKAIHEPTFEHLNLLVRDGAHLGMMLTGATSYLSLVSAADMLVQIYKGEYTQVLTQAGAAAGYILLPTVLGTSFAPLYTASVLAYTGYKLADNLYTVYSNYGTSEFLLKSNLAYATLESNLGLKDLAKECLVSAMQIVKEDFELNHNHNSPVQQIATEYNLVGKLCEISADYDYC